MEADAPHRQVRFVGNCQAAALAAFYARFIGQPSREEVVYIDDLGRDEAAIRDACTGADLVIVQERDFKRGLSREALDTPELHTFPMVMAGFLWPFANEPHVRNVAERPVSDGPYASQMADSFLNRLFVKGVSPEDALEQYLQLDIARAAGLDRMLDIYLERQRQRDTATGYSIADRIEARFRHEKLFLTAEHPGAYLFGLVVGELFGRLGLPADTVANAVASLYCSPFPPTELPLHPGVIAHFGLTFAAAGDAYEFLDEGRFTFAEYVLRYMRYESNQPLRFALHAAVTGTPPGEALMALDDALAGSPRSVQGRRARARLLERLGRYEEQRATLWEAVALDPANPETRVEFGRALFAAGNLDEAAEMALEALALAPQLGLAHLLLAETHIRAGRLEEARQPMAEAVRLLPPDGAVHRSLGIALSIGGYLAEAELHARRGMAIDPRNTNHINLAAEVVEGQARRAEAIALLEETIDLGRENDQTYSLLGNFWMRDGRLDKAEAVFARGAELHGEGRPDLVSCLADVRRARAGALAAS